MTVNVVREVENAFLKLFLYNIVIGSLLSGMLWKELCLSISGALKMRNISSFLNICLVGILSGLME